MALEDKEKTSFITDCGFLCYRIMSFDLKNIGIIYQHLINKVFRDQIGRNMEVYVDNMLVKSKSARTHIDDLGEVFAILRKYRMKLNPAKSAFRVTSEKFLDFMVSNREIEANPEKIRAMQEMAPPRMPYRKDCRFEPVVLRLAERCLPFFKILKQPKNFQWTEEC